MKISKDIADEVWRMLPDDCKKIMKPIKKSFKESIIADIDEVIKNYSIPDVVRQSEQLKAFVDWWHGLSQEELVWYECRYVEVFLNL